jgi:hypothetical protein
MTAGLSGMAGFVVSIFLNGQAVKACVSLTYMQSEEF